MSSPTDSGSGEAELREQVKVLGEKFLLRTADQIATLRAHVASLRGGDRNVLVGVQELAHKIHGSGAMFGFAALSEHAGAIERLIAADATEAQRREPREEPAARREATGAGNIESAAARTAADRLGELVEELAAALESTQRKS